jgi:hypothetical protein
MRVDAIFPVTVHVSLPYSMIGLMTVLYVLIFTFLLRYLVSRVSSGSTVSDYGLDDRAIGVRSPAEAKDFSSVSRPALGPTQLPVQWVPGV